MRAGYLLSSNGVMRQKHPTLHALEADGWPICGAGVGRMLVQILSYEYRRDDPRACPRCKTVLNRRTP